MRYLKTILFAFALLTGFTAMKAETDLKADSRQRHNVVKIISSNYDDWDRCSVSGKVKASGLMVSPTLKIYMERDKSLTISVRVPFIGEAARIEADSDSILLVNKMKKVYSSFPLKDLGVTEPVIGQLQSLLLGHPVVAGYGEVNEQTEELVDIFTAPGGGYSLIPIESVQFQDVAYGYLISKSGLIESLLISPGTTQAADGDNMFTINFDHSRGGMTASCELQRKGGKAVSFRLELGNPDYSASLPKQFVPGTGFRKVTLNEFMKSF